MCPMGSSGIPWPLPAGGQGKVEVLGCKGEPWGRGVSAGLDFLLHLGWGPQAWREAPGVPALPSLVSPGAAGSPHLPPPASWRSNHVAQTVKKIILPS